MVHFGQKRARKQRIDSARKRILSFSKTLYHDTPESANHEKARQKHNNGNYETKREEFSTNDLN
jgi:hypothetical protein